MKAFLFFPDRDFDPSQILVARERESRSRKPAPGLDLEALLPANAEDLTRDLGLNVVIQAMAGDDTFKQEVAKVALLSGSADREVVLYRQRVMQDCLLYPDVVREIYQIACDAINASRKAFWTSFRRYPSGTLHSAMTALTSYLEQFRRLRRLADANAALFRSRGFRNLFTMLRAELSDAYLAEVEAHLRRLQFRDGVLVSARLGPGNKGVDYILRRPKQELNWLTRWWPQASSGYTFRLHPRDEAGAQALSNLRDQGVNLIANAAGQASDHIGSFFHMLRTELAFYVGSIDLHERLEAIDEPTCFPDPVPLGNRTLAYRELYDPALALSKGAKVVGNSHAGDGKNLILVTGANTGGKSTYLRSLALGQLMMQAGMFVAAEHFAAELREGLFTHFRREEDRAMESGKLDEELARMSGIIERITPDAMIFLNESFSSTNEREGSEIASQVAEALLATGVKIAVVTHLYEFARRLHAKQDLAALFLRADRQSDGTRSFRLVEGNPLQTSYGEDLYRRVFGEGTVEAVSGRPSSIASDADRRPLVETGQFPDA